MSKKRLLIPAIDTTLLGGNNDQVLPPFRPPVPNRVKLLMINNTDSQLILGSLPQGAGRVTCGNGNGYIGPHQALQFNFYETFTGNLDFVLNYEIYNSGTFSIAVMGRQGRTPANQYVQMQGYVTTDDVDIYYLGTKNNVKLFNVVVSN